MLRSIPPSPTLLMGFFVSPVCFSWVGGHSMNETEQTCPRQAHSPGNGDPKRSHHPELASHRSCECLGGRRQELGAERCRGQKKWECPRLLLPALPPLRLDSDAQPGSRGLGCILGVGPKTRLPRTAVPVQSHLPSQDGPPPAWGQVLHLPCAAQWPGIRDGCCDPLEPPSQDQGAEKRCVSNQGPC